MAAALAIHTLAAAAECTVRRAPCEVFGGSFANLSGGFAWAQAEGADYPSARGAPSMTRKLTTPQSRRTARDVHAMRRWDAGGGGGHDPSSRGLVRAHPEGDGE
jgi:hypothetical protein